MHKYIGRQHLSSMKKDSSPTLPHMTPIKCGECGGASHLLDRRPEASKEKVREIWTFECEQCGARQSRSEDP